MRMLYYVREFPGSTGVITEPIAAHLDHPLMQSWRQWLGPLEGQRELDIGWVERGRHGPDWHIEFTNGCTILLRAAEAPERLIGFEAAWAWMDEAATTEGGSQEMAYFKLVGRLRQKGFPHWLGITTTPAGRNWLWREWGEPTGKINPGTCLRPRHALFMASSADNPFNEEDYVLDMTETYGYGTPMYRQYVLGEFVQMEGLVLPTFDPDKMVAPWPDELFLGKIAGVDFGAQSPTTIVEPAITQSRKVWMREWLYKRECDDETFVKACRDAMDAGVTLFVCDPSGKERIRWMQEQGIPAVKARSNKIADRVKVWLTLIGQGRLTVDSGSPFLIREVMGLSWAKRRGRELETDRFDPNTPDHAFDAGAYALMEIESMVLDWTPPKITEW
jgi:phage terminase large subunit